MNKSVGNISSNRRNSNNLSNSSKGNFVKPDTNNA